MSDEAGKQASAQPPVPGPAETPPPEISYEEFRRINLRIGVVTAAQDHPNADRLLLLTVDLGDGVPRQLVAGIRGAYRAEEMIGKRVVVVANLKPATIRGVQSQGMVLATQDATGLSLLTPDRSVQPGSLVK